MLSTPLYEEHGGLELAELKKKGIRIDNLLDFSVNSNPFGPSPCIEKALKHVDISRYPDRDCSDLACQLAALNCVSQGQLRVGNGTTELIWLIAQAYIKPQDQVLIIGPTFSEYLRASKRHKALVSEISARAPDFNPPIGEAVDFIHANHPRLVFFCNPNNPTGKSVTEERIQELIDACGEETLLVIDRSYSAFLNGSFFETKPNTNTLTLRSMTKDFALAGLRLGYVIGNEARIAQIKDIQPTWSVNAFAQAAGLAALNDLNYYRKTLGLLRGIQASFYADLRSIGYHLINSNLHFVLIHIEGSAGIVRSQLLLSGLQVRDCTSFGLPDYIRVCTHRSAENIKLITAMKALRNMRFVEKRTTPILK